MCKLYIWGSVMDGVMTMADVRARTHTTPFGSPTPSSSLLHFHFPPYYASHNALHDHNSLPHTYSRISVANSPLTTFKVHRHLFFALSYGFTSSCPPVVVDNGSRR